MFGSSLPVKIAETAIVGVFASTAGFFVWTKHCDFKFPLDRETEPLYKTPWYKQFNPRDNPHLSDSCVRRIPLHHLKYEILEDAKQGGSKLVEAFTQGCFGGFNFTVQRLNHGRGLSIEEKTRLLPLDEAPQPDSTIVNSQPQTQPSQSSTSRFSSLWATPNGSTITPSPNPSWKTPELPASSSPSPPEHLFTKSALLHSSYPVGTIITNHFLVLSHTPTSILLRCGASPFDSPASPRESDGLFELSAVPHFDKGYAEFRLTSLFYNGAAEKAEAMGPFMAWLHRQYTKLWMEAALRNVRMSKFRSQKAQIKNAKEEMKRIKKAEQEVEVDNERIVKR